MASALLALGLLHESRGQIPAARAALAAALRVFPAFIAARAAAARLMVADAASDAELSEAEAALLQAVEVAEALAAAEGGLVAASNKACAREVEAGVGARGALAMLLCQAGRGAEAKTHLKELGFSWRLGSPVLCYPISGGGSSSPAGRGEAAGGRGEACGQLPLAVLDGALPSPLLRQLQRAFAPAAPFWSEHGYGPRQGYFSYMFPLVGA
jgi:hypothetical protein